MLRASHILIAHEDATRSQRNVSREEALFLIADIQKRMYEDYKATQVTDDEGYSNELSVMVNEILHTSSIADVNNVLVTYSHYLPNEYLTLDGTLNYVIALLAK